MYNRFSQRCDRYGTSKTVTSLCDIHQYYFNQQKGEPVNIKVGQKLYNNKLNEVVVVKDKFYVRHINTAQQETILRVATCYNMPILVNEETLYNDYSLIIDKLEPKSESAEDLPWDKFEELLPGARWIAKDLAYGSTIYIYTHKPKIHDNNIWIEQGDTLYKKVLEKDFPQVYAFFADIPWKESLIENHKEHRVLEYEIVNVICDYGNKVNVQIRITKQSHRRENFVNGSDNNNIFRHNGFKIKSFYSPSDGDGNCIYVRGENTKSDNDIIEMPLNKFNRFKEAVEAYNKLYN